MGSRLVRICAVAVVLVAIAVAYKVLVAPVNSDWRNYEVRFTKPSTWMELPHQPSTLLLMRDPKTHALLRCSTTQVVDAENPEPDVDTDKMIARVVSNAQENQAEWSTEKVADHDTGKIRFGMFRKKNKGKTIVGAMAVRGNTTLLVSISNTGAGAKLLLDEAGLADFLSFLNTMELVVSDKWDRIHAKYDTMRDP